MINDAITYGGNGEGSSWYYHYEMEALLDPQMAEQNWFSEPRPDAVSHMHEVFAKHAAMTEEEKQAERDRVMAMIDRALGL